MKAKIKRNKIINGVQFSIIAHVNFTAELNDGIKTKVKDYYFEVTRAEDKATFYQNDLHYFDIEKLLSAEILENYHYYLTILNKQLTQYNLRIEQNDLQDLKDLANDKETTVSHLIKQQIKKLLQNEKV